MDDKMDDIKVKVKVESEDCAISRSADSAQRNVLSGIDTVDYDPAVEDLRSVLNEIPKIWEGILGSLNIPKDTWSHELKE